MGRLPFDLRFLRRGMDGVVVPAELKGFTRREVVFGAAAAAAAIPLSRGLPDLAWGAFDVVYSTGRAALTVGGVERFVLDVSRYAGSPRLTVETTDGTTEIALSGALYPGTAIPADLRLTAYTGVTGERLRIRGTWGGFEANVSLRDWLDGTAARSPVRIEEAAADAGPLSLVAGGPAEMAIATSGEISVTGPGIARLHGLGGVLESDAFTLRTADGSVPSAFARTPSRRTLMRLRRGAHDWPIAPEFASDTIGDLDWEPGAFDAVDLEFAGTKCAARAVAVASSDSEGRVAWYRTAALGHANALIPLASPRYAVAWDSRGRASALTARYESHAWVPVPGGSIRVGPATGAPGFEATGRGETLTAAVCSPAFTGAVPAHDGNVVLESVLAQGKASRLVPLGDTAVPAGVKRSAVAVVSAAAGSIYPVPDLVVVRPDDLLVVTLKFYNLTLSYSAETARWQLLQSPNAGAHIVAEFPPQHLLEQAFYEATYGSDTRGSRPVKSRWALPSRLAFTVPFGPDPIPYDLTTLLDFRNFQPTLVPAALDGASVPVTITKPTELETAIELPTRLNISPNASARWVNADGPVSIGPDALGRTWTELWHTVAIEGDRWSADTPTSLRAVWSPDYKASAPFPVPSSSPTFRTSLDAYDRHALVKIMGQYHFAPAMARLLALSALGGWIDLKAEWDPTTYDAYPDMSEIEVVKWEHRATMGRDHYVKVVYAGHLFPFGHRAVLIKVTERRFRDDPGSSGSDKPTAYLIQKMFLAILQKEMDYGSPDTARSRGIPFRKIRIETERTPELDPIGVGIGGKGQECFWPKAGSTEFVFRMVGVDGTGREVGFSAPAIFVSRKYDTPATVAVHDFLHDTVLKEYLSTDPVKKTRRVRMLDGQSLAYAPEGATGDTTLETGGLAFTAEILPALTMVPGVETRWYPLMDYSLVRMRGVGELTGGSPLALVRYPKAYLDNGFAGGAAKNDGQLFLELLPTAQIPVGFPGDKSGGISTPSFTASGLSRTYGAISGDPAKFAGGQFDPTDFFDTSAKLLGGITLGDIIDTVTMAAGATAADVPRMTETRDGDTLTVVYEWKTAGLKKLAIFVPDTDSDPAKAASLELTAKVITDLSLTVPPSSEVTGRLANFTLDLVRPLSFITIAFDDITFTSLNGATPTIDVNLGEEGVKFSEELAFVGELAKYVSFAKPGAGTTSIAAAESGPDIQVDAKGITAGYTLAIPKIAVGMFSIEELAFSAKLRLPFDGSPVRLRLAFSERDKPFLIGVLIFAGGGFFAIALGADGMESLEASLEFGGQLSLSLGVASGAVYARGGVYFGLKYEGSAQAVTLSAFIRMGGAVEVLGLITVSIEFYVALNYTKVGAKGKLWGQAKLTVEVEVLFFSESVELEVERELAGSDPGFAEMYPPDNRIDPYHSTIWENYCAAFEPGPVG